MNEFWFLVFVWWEFLSALLSIGLGAFRVKKPKSETYGASAVIAGLLGILLVFLVLYA